MRQVLLGLVEADCPLCGSRKPEPWAEERGFRAVRCGECRLLYVSPRPVEDDIDAAVTMGVHSDGLNVIGRRIGSKVRHYRRVLKPMFPELDRRPFKWLDVGAGFGEVVEAVKLAWPDAEAFGMEPMKAKAEDARSRGLDIRNEYLGPNEHQVDVISINDVFSHIPDFRGFLQTIRSNLKPGGSLLVVTGNLADLERREEFPGILGLPDHLVFAGEAQIGRFLSEAGFTVRRIERERFDTIVQSLKIVAKKALGRPVHIALPYTSRYRSMVIRADMSAPPRGWL